MGKIKLFLLLSFLFLPFQTAALEKRAIAYLSELELVRGAMADSLPVCFAGIPLASRIGVRLKALTENKANWLMENSLTKMLLEQGYYTVRPSEETNSAVPSSPNHTLSYRIADLKFEYWHPRGSIFKKKFIRRRMRLDCFFSLSEPKSSVIVWSKWMHIQWEDLVPAAGEEALKNDIFSQRTVLQDKSRWIEILVVVGVISSMAYTLF